MQFVDLNAQHEDLAEELQAAMAAVIRDSAFVRGPHVDAFEANFARALGVRHCVSCANGTDALYIALRALGVGPGDEVITTAHSWIATSETITQTGARVVFNDTEPDYFCIDPVTIEDRITERTRGIVAVHLYGQPAAMGPILELARRRGLWVIEDCAQAHLASLDGRLVGTLGDVAAFSFYPGKNLGAMGDAGCLVTNRDDLAGFAALFARHGGKNDHVMEGINSRLDGLQAAILNVKLPCLAGWNKTRMRMAALYDAELATVPEVTVPAVRPGARHVYHLYVIRVPRRDELQKFLARRGIPTAINYPRALPHYPAYAYLGHGPESFPVAGGHAREILSLPMHPHLTEGDVVTVAAAIAEFFGQG
ncbi:MAG: DegT/DnrJ/EryC1/StrS family aminotransferase [Magnetococcales bacterium]|nr:DegT/DnrJ/EryC1/StrS family aminotransferase [Magnetococcales bacterium]